MHTTFSRKWSIPFITWKWIFIGVERVFVCPYRKYCQKANVTIKLLCGVKIKINSMIPVYTSMFEFNTHNSVPRTVMGATKRFDAGYNCSNERLINNKERILWGNNNTVWSASQRTKRQRDRETEKTVFKYSREDYHMKKAAEQSCVCANLHEWSDWWHILNICGALMQTTALNKKCDCSSMKRRRPYSLSKRGFYQ